MIREQKKIVMLGDVNLNTPNAGRVHFLNLAKEFSRLGLRVIVILPKSKKNINFPDEKFKIRFTRAYWYKNHFPRAVLTYPFFLPLCAREFFQNPDFFYVRISPLMFAPIWLVKILKKVFRKPQIKIIGEVNGWLEEELGTVKMGKMKRFLEKWFFKWSICSCDCLRAVTPELKKLCESKFSISPERILVAGNGTDTEQFRPIDKNKARKELSINPQTFWIGFVGGLFRWQGLHYLLDGLPLILKEIPNAKLLIVGDGPELQPLKGRAKELGIEEKSVFEGSVPSEKVPLYINSFDIAVAPFTKEREISGTSALKMYEYMACGVAIVASRMKNFEFLEKEGAGVLVEPENSEKLARVIIELFKNPQERLRMGRVARRLAKEQFSWQKIANQITDYVENQQQYK